MKKNNQKESKRTLEHIFRTDPEKRSQFLQEICSGTLRSPSSVYHWIYARRTPCFLEQKFIQGKVNEMYGLDVPLTELFPEKEK